VRSKHPIPCLKLLVPRMNRLQQKTRSCSLLLLAACRPKQSQLLPYSWKMVNGSESLLRLEYQARSLLSRSPRSALAGSSAVPNLDLTSTVSPWRASCSHHRSLPLSFLVNGNIHSWWSRSEDTTRTKSPSSIVPATQSLQFRTGVLRKVNDRWLGKQHEGRALVQAPGTG
jgi:hypothetical protein